MRRLARILGTIMIACGVLSIGWAITVWQWQDPFTALYTKYRQGQLASAYDDLATEYRAPAAVSTGNAPAPADPPRSLEQQKAELALAARRFRLGLETGRPLGRLKVPRLGLSAIVVEGTDDASLKSGPGRDPHTFVPGEGELVYIAGHRTTYGAPFAEIDKLRAGDRVTFELPYAVFEYEITRHVIVDAHRVDVLASKGEEVLALQACHPRFFATQRWIAYARPVRVIPREGEPYSLRGERETIAAADSQPIAIGS